MWWKARAPMPQGTSLNDRPARMRASGLPHAYPRFASASLMAAMVAGPATPSASMPASS